MAEGAATGKKPPTKNGGGWGAPLGRLDHVWTRVEQALCAAVLVAEVLALCLQITLTGLSRGYGEGENAAGVVYRAILGGAVLGVVAHLLTRPKKKEDERRHTIAVSVAIAAGIVFGRLWANAGVAYASNAQNWIQNASALMLIGGLRPPGLVSRLTLWLALLGASLATASGKHINIDVMMRFLPVGLRKPVAVVGWLAAAAMCFAAVVGFTDNIAVEGFKIPITRPCEAGGARQCPTPASEKLGRMREGMSNDLFLLGRQFSLDLKTLPRVLAGEPYDKYMTAGEWNAWMGEADWSAHYPADAVKWQMMDESTPGLTRLPAVNVPGGAEARGLLIRDMNFVFPFGLLMIGLRFLLRTLLVVSGEIDFDPDAALAEEEKEIEKAREEPDGEPPAPKEAA